MVISNAYHCRIFCSELQRASYFVILPILYVLGLILSLEKRLSAVISHFEKFDLNTTHQHHYMMTLESCFFYAVINVLLRGIEPAHLQFTVTIFCISLAGSWWNNKQSAYWNSVGRIFFKTTETTTKETVTNLRNSHSQSQSTQESMEACPCQIVPIH